MTAARLVHLGVAASVAAALFALASSAEAGGTLRVAMTASDVPTTIGAPDNDFEGMRFLGYPVYVGLLSWDLSRADNKPTVCIAGR
jgi:peptide/nickel transport system substrate-binding protein